MDELVAQVVPAEVERHNRRAEDRASLCEIAFAPRDWNQTSEWEEGPLVLNGAEFLAVPGLAEKVLCVSRVERRWLPLLGGFRIAHASGSIRRAQIGVLSYG